MKKLAGVFALLVLSACASEPPPAIPVKAVMPPRINLDVLTISIVDHTNPQSNDSPYNTNNFQPTIVSAIRQWAVQNIVAVGTTGEAVVVIEDASLNGQALAHRDDWFERQQASKYTAHAQVEIRVSGRAGQHGNVVAEASRYTTLPENPSALERQNAYATVFNGLMHDLGDKLSSGMQAHLGTFIVTAPVMKRSGN